MHAPVDAPPKRVVFRVVMVMTVVIAAPVAGAGEAVKWC
jgi:hypothetical protein